MSRQLTQAEISAPDVVLRIPAGARLPKSVQDLLFGYSGYLRGNFYVYRVASYVAKDIEQALRAAQHRVNSDKGDSPLEAGLSLPAHQSV